MQKNLKYDAALAAINYVQSGMSIGLGTGSTTRFFIEILGSMIKSGEMQDIRAVPTSEGTAFLAEKLGIELATLSDYPTLDIAVDGADEVDNDLNLIKGLGMALLREKIVEVHAKEFIVIVDESKRVDILGKKGPLPVEITKFEANAHVYWLNNLGCRAELWCDSYDEPYVTDNGNFIARCWFDGGIRNPYDLADKLDKQPGILEHGLFLDMATRVIVADVSGIHIIDRKNE